MFRTPRRSACLPAAALLAFFATSPAFGQGNCFNEGTSVNTATSPKAMATADLDNDGDPDIVTANFTAGSVTVLRNNNKLTFSNVGSYTIGPNTTGVALGDLNGDDLPDIVACCLGPLDGGCLCYPSGKVVVRLNLGNDTFGPPTEYATEDEPQAVVVRDFQGDNKLDVACISADTDVVMTYRGNGTGALGEVNSFLAGPFPIALAAGDFDADGDTDLIVANNSTNTATILFNTDGNGTFTSTTAYPSPGGPIAIAVADVNGDTFEDVLIANASNNTVVVYFCNGDGTLSPSDTYGTGFGPVALAVGDLNGDNRPELVVANYTTNSLAMYVNDGLGGYQAFLPYVFPSGFAPSALVAMRANSDTPRDIAVASYNQNRIAVLLNGAANVAEQPESLSLHRTQTAVFHVSASGQGPFTYRWRRDATDLNNGPSIGGGTISGATTNTLTITNIGVADGGARYTCRVTNLCGTVASEGAFLGVNPFCPADFDQDGFVTGVDFDLYVQAFEAGEPSADFDNDGFVTGADFDQFVAAFEVLCE